MPAPIYTCSTEGAVALASNAAKTIVGAKAHANSGLLLVGFWAGIDGTDHTKTPVTVEIMYSTWATNSPGTNSTSTTARQVNGRVLTAGFTAGKSWSTEPTTLTLLMPEFYLSAAESTIVYDFPLGTEADSALGEGFVMRVTTVTGSGTPNIRAGFKVSRC